jgi:site-specific DNA-methyltransferase (adenine-specific)
VNPIITDKYTLFQGDCLEYMRSMSEGSVDSIVTDPPYELGNHCGTSDLYGSRRMEFEYDIEGITETVLSAFSLALPMAQSFHSFCGFEQYGKISDLARSLGFTPKPYIKIKKCPPPPMPGNWWPSGVECAIYGYKSGAYFGDQTAKRVNIFYGDSYRHGIRASEKVEHPTQKWLPMIAYIVETLCPPKGIIFDPFMGSGTTGVACMQLGRRFIGCEIDPGYFEIARKRIEAAASQMIMPLETK